MHAKPTLRITVPIVTKRNDNDLFYIYYCCGIPVGFIDFLFIYMFLNHWCLAAGYVCVLKIGFGTDLLCLVHYVNAMFIRVASDELWVSFKCFWTRVSNRDVPDLAVVLDSVTAGFSLCKLGFHVNYILVSLLLHRASCWLCDN